MITPQGYDRIKVFATITNSKPIAVIDAATNKVYRYYVGGRYAAKKLGISYTCIQIRVGRAHKVYKGYRFEYVTNEEIKNKIIGLYSTRKLGYNVLDLPRRKVYKRRPKIVTKE